MPNGVGNSHAPGTNHAYEVEAEEHEATTSPQFCKAICTAEAYDTEQIRLLSGCGDIVLRNISLYEAEGVHRRFGSGEIFYFSNGVVVLWGLKPKEEATILAEVKKYEIRPHSKPEVEVMEIHFHPKPFPLCDGNSVCLPDPSLFPLEEPTDIQIKLSYSYGIYKSVLLESFSVQVEELIDRLKDIPHQIARTKFFAIPKIVFKPVFPFLESKAKREAKMILAELMRMRGLINLHSDLLSDSDLFWEELKLEKNYLQILQCHEVSTRIHNLNERLNYSKEMLDVVLDIQNEDNSGITNWLIIILIALEVMVAFSKGHSEPPKEYQPPV